ncbi:flagellar basal body-associated protein FliL [Bacillus marinisedimentorum]|uniref:flagellar basal body-associated protein FliL n=1 Tax=Bacillus marinisedimentorum TaxID=1821260 RepID=UPI0007E1CD3D|nr:flagellar basal body-associated protein FliL [Bacillus marinisedimentorum]
MLKSKFARAMLVTLSAIVLIGATAVIVLMVLDKRDAEAAEPSIDQILEASIDTEEITTNLLSDDYVRIQFKIQADSKEAKNELAKRDFQVRNIVIQELASMKAGDFEGKEGIRRIEEQLELQLNEVLKEGTVEKVYTTSFILQ